MRNSDRVRPADPCGRVWHVLDDAGNQIGACSSREDALRIAALIGPVSHPCRETSEPPAVRNFAETKDHADEPRPTILEWYSARPDRAAWMPIRDFYLRARTLLLRYSARAR